MQHLANSRPHLATVTITHHLEELFPEVSHALVLQDGRVLTHGRVDEAVTGPWLTRCFGRPITVARHDGRWTARSSHSSAQYCNHSYGVWPQRL